MKLISLFLGFLLSCLFTFGQETGNDAVVSATKMNILYRGIQNPIEIAVPGIPSSKVTATATNGTITKTATGWEIAPGGESESVVTVLVNNKKAGEKTFRIKAIPMPVAVFAGKNTGTVNKSTAVNVDGLEVELRDFALDLKFEIKSFTFLMSKDGFDYELKSEGNKFSAEMKALLADFQRGRAIVFKDIKAVGPDGKTMELSPVILKID
jgi:gliding motility-associated protein GldM